MRVLLSYICIMYNIIQVRWKIQRCKLKAVVTQTPICVAEINVALRFRIEDIFYIRS